MQSVLFSWLVVGVLQLEARWVGITQSATMIPSVLLVMLGGVVADRRDRRNLLVALHAVACATGAILALVVAQGWLTLPILIAYGFAIGSIQAFVTPARDSLLSDVAGGNMMKAVTGMNLAQWGFQSLGSAAGAAARWVGIVPALCVPPLVLLAGSALFGRLRPAPPRPGVAREPLRLSDLAVGGRIVLRSPLLGPIFGLTIAVGILFGGPFMVVFPLLVRDYYGGDVAQLGLFMMVFPLGTILGSVLLLLRGGIRRKGRAQLLALAAGAGCLGVISLGLPFPLALVAVCAWGVSGSVFMNASRTVFQQEAPTDERARVLSTYTLGFMGAGGLVGAPLSGFLADWLGPLGALSVSAATMLAAVATVSLTTRISRIP
jgi:MFS family permease